MDSGPDPVTDGARLRALRASALLDSPAEDRFDRFTRLAARLLGVPVSLVSLVEEDRQFFKSCLGLPEPWAGLRETPLSHSFCKHVVRSGKPVLLEDAREHPLAHDNLAIRDLGVIAYAGVPLVTYGGQVLGTFCAADTKPRSWSDEDVQALRDLAAAVMTEIELEGTVERRTAELRDALHAAEAASRAKTQFLANISHEIRTPLTTLRGPLALVQRMDGDGLSPQGRHMLEVALRASARLEGVLLDTLLLTAIQSGEVPVKPSEVRLDALLGELASELGPAAASKDLPLRVVTPPAPPVYADGARLKEVLRRIVENAISFTSEGSVTLELVPPGPAGPAEIRVRDTGPGIPEDRLEAIFQPFEQADNSDTRAHQGSGMGLAIARWLCELQGHTLAVQSRAGEGSTFRVVLGKPAEAG